MQRDKLRLLFCLFGARWATRWRMLIRMKLNFLTGRLLMPFLWLSCRIELLSWKPFAESPVTVSPTTGTAVRSISLFSFSLSHTVAAGLVVWVSKLSNEESPVEASPFKASPLESSPFEPSSSFKRPVPNRSHASNEAWIIRINLFQLLPVFFPVQALNGQLLLTTSQWLLSQLTLILPSRVPFVSSSFWV